MIVYLAGPILGCTDEECGDWRKYVIAHYKGEALDPTKWDYRGREDENVTKIVEDDKALIDRSDVLLVNFTKPSVGTSMEVLYAWERGKKVVIVAREGEVISPWLRYHSNDTIMHSLDEAIGYIEGLNSIS